MFIKSVSYLCSALVIGLMAGAGPVQAQDSKTVDCFYTANKTDPACQVAETKVAKPAAARTKSRKGAQESFEPMAESVDCFFAFNASHAACSTTKARPSSSSRAADHFVRDNSKHGS